MWLDPDLLNHVIPESPVMLAACNWAMHGLHSVLVVFALLGWVYKPWRRVHLLVLGLIWASWLLIGFLVGTIGYCLLTDWHWRILEALGERHLPSSYIDYLVFHATGFLPDPQMSYQLTAVVFVLITLLSLWLNGRGRRRR